jgi:tetratricopeptide (TPR) repeat protein
MNKPLTHLLLIAVLGLLIYSNTFHSPFQWDEEIYLLENPVVKDLGYFMDTSRAEGLPVYDGLKSRYIGYLTFALNYKLHGFNVPGYHIVNIAIHLINAMLVYLLVLLTFRTPFFLPPNPPLARGGTEEGSLFTIHFSRLFALAVSLLFVAHPLQTEAVTYIFQRFASLVSLFYLLSLVLYIKGRQIQVEAKVKVEKDSNSTLRPHSSALICFILSFLSAVLAMKTKENAFTLPIVITLYEFLFFSGPVKTRLLRLAPFLLTMLIVPLTIMGTGATPGEIISQVKDPASLGFITPTPADYLFTQFRVIVTYIRLLLLPVNQNIYHDLPIYQSFFTPPVFLSFLFLASLFGIAVYLLYKTRSEKRKTQSVENSVPYATCALRLVAFGILWFFITLSVESSIIPIPMIIDEYRVYLPSVGFFLALVTCGFLLVQRFARPSPKKEKLAIAAFALVVFVLASATYARNTLWENKISLWTDVVKKSPDFPLGYNNLGIAYYEKGLQDEAIGMYERAISISPKYLDAYVNLGAAYSAIGRPGMAIEIFKKVIAMYPKTSTAYFNLARAYAGSGRNQDALDNYLKAIELDPYDSAAYHGLGTTYARLGRLDDSLAAFTKFVTLSPRDPESYRNRAIIYAAKGDFINASADFQQSCSLGNRESCAYLEGPRFR